MQGISITIVRRTLLSALIAWVCAGSVSATEVKVNAERVILRAAPSETSEVVFQVSEGDILVAEKAIDVEWIEVVPPSRVNFWVYGELIKDGAVASSRLQVRVGPGINYRTIGELAKDAKISVRGEYKEWLKIAPPPGCRLWVNRKSVDPVEQPLPLVAMPAPADKTAVPVKVLEVPERHLAPVKPVVKPPVSHLPEEPARSILKRDSSSPSIQLPAERKNTVVISPEMLIKDKLVSSKEQGRVIRRDGALRVSGFFVWRQPSKYRLVVHDSNGVAITVCYVIGDEKTMVSMQDRDVIVQGREYWMQGVRQPVVIFDRILLKE